MEISVNSDSMSDNPPEYNIVVKSLLPSYSEATGQAEFTIGLISPETAATTQIEIANEIQPRSTKNA